MKKIFVLTFVIVSIAFAQSLPFTFELESNKAKKASAANPASNTIEDIVVDDNGTVWLATSRGLSKSTDDGKDWTNYYQTEAFGIKKVSKVGYHNGTNLGRNMGFCRSFW
ncbi:MAG: hypothetical protein U5K00_13700 [Melioribacteraceae bacterium]|nr:hypothetical protein [Melioribacteraceae bacterium]